MDMSIFQSSEWEEFKLKTGYEKSYRISDILILQKKLPFSRTMLYAPMVDSKQLQEKIDKEFIDQVKKIGRDNNSIFFRLELNTSADLKHKSLKDFKKSFEEMQPEHNWLLDITQGKEEILKNMKQKGRYNIRIAEKNNVSVTSTQKIGKELDVFYNQYSKTGKRHSISYRQQKYFDALLETFGKKDYARVYTAWKDNEIPLASAIILFDKKSALYLYGGSADSFRNLMAPYLLHWRIILDAKEKGLKEYNFLGIAPDDNKNHPWAGITRFKKQFGGYEEHILGSNDLVLKPVEYELFKIAEKIRR